MDRAHAAPGRRRGRSSPRRRLPRSGGHAWPWPSISRCRGPTWPRWWPDGRLARRAGPGALGLLCGAVAPSGRRSRPWSGSAAVRPQPDAVSRRCSAGWLAAPRRLAWRVTGAWRGRWWLGAGRGGELAAWSSPASSTSRCRRWPRSRPRTTVSGLAPAGTACWWPWRPWRCCVGAAALRRAWGAAARARRVAWLAAADRRRARRVDLRRALAGALDPALLNRPPWIRLGRAAGPGRRRQRASGASAALVGPLLALRAGSAAARARRGRRPSGRRLVCRWRAASVASGVADGAAASGWPDSWSLAIARRQAAPAGRARRRGRSRSPRSWSSARRRCAPGAGNALARAARDTVRRADVDGGGRPASCCLDRYGYGPAATGVIAEYPWVRRRHRHVRPRHVRRTRGRHLGIPLLADNAQNWWRQQCGRTGRWSAASAALRCRCWRLLSRCWRCGAAPARRGDRLRRATGRGRPDAAGHRSADAAPVCRCSWPGCWSLAPRHRASRQSTVGAACGAGRWCRRSWPGGRGLRRRPRGGRAGPRSGAAARAAGSVFLRLRRPRRVDPHAPAGDGWWPARRRWSAPAGGPALVAQRVVAAPRRSGDARRSQVTIVGRRQPGVPPRGATTDARRVPRADRAGRGGWPLVQVDVSRACGGHRRGRRARRRWSRHALRALTGSVSAGRTRRSPRRHAPDAPSGSSG